MSDTIAVRHQFEGVWVRHGQLAPWAGRMHLQPDCHTINYHRERNELKTEDEARRMGFTRFCWWCWNA